MAKKRYSKKTIRKLVAKRCFFCPENDPDVLDAHRILPGEDGGQYLEHNILVVCANCHRRCHSGAIRLDRKYPSTKGPVLHFWADGVEHWVAESDRTG